MQTTYLPKVCWLRIIVRDGKLEGMPLLENVFVLAYNKDLFDQFGVDYPTDDWTWDDLKEAAEKFVSGEGADATYGIVNHWVEPNFALICEGRKPVQR